MTALTIPQAIILRAAARRIEGEVAQTLHRVTAADPYGRHPETEAALRRLAQDGADCAALFRALDTFLEARP